MDINLIQNLKNQAISSILESKSENELEQIRREYLGRNGEINKLLKSLSSFKERERKELGFLLNETKKTLEDALKNQVLIIERQKNAEDKWFDFTLPGIKPPQGHLHLITQTIKEITTIFEKIGFNRVAYPEVEWDWYAFEGLNMPKNHPARDEWETFFVKDLYHPRYGEAVLTPHTSSGQLREMERLGQTLTAGGQAPIRMLNIAKCYRRQIDASHAPMFYQFEGLVVDENINITHLKGTLDFFVKQYFGFQKESRLRPYHFQFTEPSFEIDVSCLVCGGTGRLPNGQPCKVCKEGWMEVGGAGMVHPKVLENGGIDPKKYTGFAFGWGVERLLMMKYKIDDIRLLFGSDLRFLEQF
jgi:phenylalanyl-tRNA synthetase alpha chain